MKNNILLKSSLVLATILSAVSCSTNEEINNETTPPAVTRSVGGDIDDMSEGSFDEETNDDTGIRSTTRSSFVWNNETSKYESKWTTGDHIAVYSTEDARADYALKSGDNSSSATFNGGGFDLKENNKYYSFSNYSITTKGELGNSTPNIREIYMSYEGQVQNGNDNSNHLGEFEYLAASAIATAGNHATFHFKHLGSVLRFFITLPDDETSDNVTFTKMTIKDYNTTTGERKFYQPLQVLDMTAGGDVDNYAPYLSNAPLKHGETIDDIKPITLTLKDGDNDGITIAKNAQLILHVFVPALKIGGQQVQCVFDTSTPDVHGNNKKYYLTFVPTDLKQGKYYTIRRKVIPTGNLSLRIKVNPFWQLGSTTTRADQGDPGYGKECHAPKYLYPFVVLEGSGMTISNEKFHSFGELKPTTEQWSQNSDGEFLYNESLLYSYTGTASEGRVYVIASDYKLDLGSISDEATLKALSYSVPTSFTDADKKTSSVTDDECKQDFLKNLYSTPLVTSAKVPFTGTVVGLDTNTPSANVTLYHVAAKVDVQWNTANTATQLPTTNSYVSVNNVNNTGLFYFKPTENGTNTGSYTVKEPITPGTMYIGRQVFYLPQFADPTYSIKIGDGTSTPNYSGNVPFTPSTTNGWTSWLKANIDIK